jgi:Uma2 family endonuclease
MVETLISVEEYLHTSYEHDLEYVDGRLEERGIPTREHGELMGRVWVLLLRRGVKAYLETRTRTSETRYRLPDVSAPLLCVQILSPDDRMSRVIEVADDFLGMRVPVVWVLDPVRKTAYVIDANGLRQVMGEIEAMDGRLRLPLAEIFSDDDVEVRSPGGMIGLEWRHEHC